VERSIQKAYKTLIANSEHFIYIENQYFISGLASNKISNPIGRAIRDRIEIAIKKEQKKKNLRLLLYFLFTQMAKFIKIHTLKQLWPGNLIQ